MESKKLLDEIKKAKYKVTPGFKACRLLDKDNGTVASLRFGIGGVYGCCGGRTVGNLNLATGGTNSKGIVDLFIKYVFTVLWERQAWTPREGMATGTKAYTLIFVSNGHNGWKQIEQVLLHMTDLYTLCAQSSNPNTGNTLKTYVARRGL